MSGLRAGVLSLLDDCYEKTGGDTPDHIIVSESEFERLSRDSKFERIVAPDTVTECYTNEVERGYIGMYVWKSRALDRRGTKALLVTEDVFQQMMEIQ